MGNQERATTAYVAASVTIHGFLLLKHADFFMNTLASATRIHYAASQIGCRHVEMGDPQLLRDERVGAQGRDGLACHVREKNPTFLGEA